MIPIWRPSQIDKDILLVCALHDQLYLNDRMLYVVLIMIDVFLIERAGTNAMHSMLHA